ncbi:uncharacterized protein I303_104538 [Kwoniella dejecticola CBS 10117]|uniref:Uncharacterized protein n=1 Tax=Kwoniella dejecticola CBS 10117 TaxID=1296121 RepID=A0A1A6A511_9TREE|nr:uncharacterized protein I303_04484 [Kwoniella dejecticola CBS 10117]OBR85152.1 hypothetical protein I303_04484 [Kwoniella dejecticola CBS 10117]
MSFLHPLRPSDSTHLTARQAGTRDEDPEIQGGMVSPDTRHHWLRYKIIFAISTVLGMTIAGITSYLLKGIERHDTPTYISNIFDVINAWVGVIYQLIT